MKWPTAQLSQGIAEVVRGVTFSQGDSIHVSREGFVPVLRAGNIAERLETLRDLVWVPERLVSDKQRLRKNDIVMCTSSGSALVVGKTAIAEDDFDGSWGAFNAVLRPTSAVVPMFLYYWLQSSEFKAWRDRKAKGANIQNIRHSDLGSLTIPFPAKSEQSRIVELLDRAESLRRQCRDADAKFARILPALFLKMFGDPATNPFGWPQGTLSEFGVKARYGLGQPPKQSNFGLPLLRATNIDAGRIVEKNLIFVGKDDVPPGRNAFLASEEVLVVRSGAYTGDVAQVTEKWAGSVAGYDLVVAPAAGWSGEFIEQYLLTPFVQRTYFASQKGRAGQPHLNSTQLEATPAFNPPESLQNAFAKQVRAVRSLRDQCIENAERLEQVFAVLLQRAFSGQLTAKWREAHMQELMAEMARQSHVLNLPMQKELETLS